MSCVFFHSKSQIILFVFSQIHNYFHQDREPSPRPGCSKYSEALSYALKPIGGYRTGFLFLWQEEAITRGRHAMTPSPHKPMDLSNNFRSELEYFRKFHTHSERIVPRHRTGDGSASCVFFTSNIKLFYSFSVKFITFYTKIENRPLSCNREHPLISV